jgi:glycerol uptake facilitator-like aquaporin
VAESADPVEAAPRAVADASLARRAGAEGLGTGALVCVVVGSGIMGERLTDNTAVTLLVNTWATVCALFVLITVFAPLSGAQFNPVVTVTAAHDRAIAWRDALIYIGAQVGGAVAGAIVANAMFDLQWTATSATDRQSGPLWFSEIVATAGLLFVITALVRSQRTQWIAVSVAAYIGAAYFFTSSTSFANPAVTVGRSITDSFSGINPGDAPMFIVMQCIGGAIGTVAARLIFATPSITRP